MNDGLWLLMQRLLKLGCLSLLLCLNGLLSPAWGRSSGATAHPTAGKAVVAGIYHEVQAGQTLWSIAQAYKVGMDTLTRANQLSGGVNAGQRLYIPGATRPRTVVSRCPCGAPTAPASPLLSSPPVPTFRPVEPTAPVQAAPSVARPSHEFSSESAMLIWPTHGEVSRGFAHQTARRHDGIDISAPRGTAIYAAADGEVIFSGWGPGGYGRMVILQHQVDVVTVYAHNQENLVSLGQRVRQGERIATVGQTGRATGNHLHFEVRRKATPISPYTLLFRRPSRMAALERG